MSNIIKGQGQWAGPTSWNIDFQMRGLAMQLGLYYRTISIRTTGWIFKTDYVVYELEGEKEKINQFNQSIQVFIEEVE